MMNIFQEGYRGRRLPLFMIFGMRIHNIVCRVGLDAMFVETKIILSN